MLQRSIDELRDTVEQRLGRRSLSSVNRFCPVCGCTEPFEPGPNGRPAAVCPQCGSLERHRLIWMFLCHETDLLTRPQRLLHFAPERCFRTRFAGLQTLDYVTADLYSPLADKKVDIQAMPFPDDSFDFIICGHVLEHIPDDRKAMAELLRVLRPGGRSLVNVPLRNGPTYEDPSIVTPEARTQHFGQHDHVRYYGLDIADRLREVGFLVDVERYLERFDHHVRQHLAIADEVLFLCTPRASR